MYRPDASSAAALHAPPYPRFTRDWMIRVPRTFSLSSLSNSGVGSLSVTITSKRTVRSIRETERRQFEQVGGGAPAEYDHRHIRVADLLEAHRMTLDLGERVSDITTSRPRRRGSSPGRPHVSTPVHAVGTTPYRTHRETANTSPSYIHSPAGLVDRTTSMQADPAFHCP